MKILFCILLITVCTIGGLKISKNYSKKEKLFFDLYNFCNFYKSNLDYFKNKLDKVFEDFNMDCGDDFRQLYCQIRENDCQSNSLLNETQLKYCINFFESLGRGDATSQKTQIVAYENYFSQQLEVAKQSYLKNGKMYSKLGVILGVLLSVLII